ncbi:MAG: hypothetical protein FWE97_04530, partial [Dehalococcoidia bacterium]|nr:hypothetical protein [Dehalococcoidia bacterium]
QRENQNRIRLESPLSQRLGRVHRCAPGCCGSDFLLVIGINSINLEGYIAEIMSKSEYSSFENKVFITGHSRGAAVANLLAAELTASQKYAQKDNIYAYTFATPNVTNSTDVKIPSKYSNIWNFVNPEDYVPYIPLSVDGWDYWKYGTTIAFESWDGKAIASLNEKFRGITGNSFNDYSFSWHGAVQKLVKNLHKLAKTSNDFYDNEPWIIALGLYYSLDSFFYDLASYLSGDMKKSEITDILLTLTKSWHYSAIAWFFIGNSGIGDNVTYAHARETYIAWVQSTNASIQYSTKIKGFYARIACPVDVEVHDGTKLIGRIVNDIVDGSLPSNLSLTVIDDEKYIYLPPGGNYSLKMIGTATGTMDYTIESLDILTMQTTAEKSFNKVALQTGKTMISSINDDLDAPDVKLFVLDANGNPVSEVLPNGMEIPYSTTKYVGIFRWRTNHEANFRNWFKFIFLFGWLWMWFI